MTDVDRYGPWAVIAGGSEGVGAEFARQLAADGFSLVLIARKPGPLEEMAEELRALGTEVRTLSVDLTASDAVATIAAQTEDLPVGLLIYNAGANSYGAEFLDGDLAGFQGVIDLNITAMLGLVQHFGRPMRERGRGGILLVGSLAGYAGGAQLSVYGGVKSFARVFTEGLWLELRDHGVDVLELVLGVTRTPAMERAGLSFDIPGMHVSEPADVAREGLAHLTDGPVWVVSGNEATVRANSTLERAKLVLGKHRAMQGLLPDRPTP